MSGHDKRGIDQSGPMQNHGTVVSLHDWRANKMASLGAGCDSATDVGEGANASTAIRKSCPPPSHNPTENGLESLSARSAPAASHPSFDPALMPEPSANAKRFMEIMSGDEDDPAFAVDVSMFFWRFSQRGMPMPKRAMALLDRHAAAGDPTCIHVRDRLRKKMIVTGRRTLWVLEGGKA